MTDRQDYYPVGDDRREEIPVLISTDKRAMAGFVDLRNVDARSAVVWHVRALRNARRWDVTEGTAQLATSGPGPNATLDVASDALYVSDVRYIRPLSPEAVNNWYR